MGASSAWSTTASHAASVEKHYVPIVTRLFRLQSNGLYKTAWQVHWEWRDDIDADGETLSAWHVLPFKTPWFGPIPQPPSLAVSAPGTIWLAALALASLAFARRRQQQGASALAAMT